MSKAHLINTRDTVITDCLEKIFDTETIFNEFYKYIDILSEQLKKLDVDYQKLKKLLIPANNGDIAFIFNWKVIEDCSYGEYILNLLMPFIKDNNFCYIHGDYGFYSDSEEIKRNKFNALNNAIYGPPLIYIDPSIFYVVYITNIGINKAIEIDKYLKRNELSYVAFADLNNNNLFKSFLSLIITQAFIKTKNTVIQCDPSIDICTLTNDLYLTNLRKHISRIKIVNIPEYYYDLFLLYKIPSLIEPQNNSDLYYSFKFLDENIKGSSIEKLKIKIDDRKIKYIFDKKKYIVDKWQKNENDLKEFLIDKIKYALISSEVFNLEIMKDYETCKFNICIEHLTKKYIISLKLIYKENTIDFITISSI